MVKIVIASNNKGKIEEIKSILEGYDLVSMEDVGFHEEIEETGNNFEENAMIKAKTIKEYLQKNNLDYWVLADDSGLCVNALDGAPGVYSARFAGEHGNSELNRKKLLEELQGVEDRSAYFQCCLALIRDNDFVVVNGKTYGTITEKAIGERAGFGYDSLFLSDDLHRTFGEVSSEEKNSVSHRRRALEELRKVLFL